MEWGPGTPGSGFIVQMGSTTGDMPGTPSPAVGGEDRDIYTNVHNEETTWQRPWVRSHRRPMSELSPEWSDCHFVVWFKSSNPFSSAPEGSIQ